MATPSSCQNAPLVEEGRQARHETPVPRPPTARRVSRRRCATSSTSGWWRARRRRRTTGTTPAGPSTRRRPPSSIPVASADERLAGRAGRPVPRDRRWRTRRRTPCGAPPARRAGTRRTRSAGCAAAPTAGRCGRRRPPRSPATWRASWGSSARVRPTLMPMPMTTAGPAEVSTRSVRMPASLRSFRSTSLGHLRLTSAPELAQGAGGGVPGEQRQPRPVRLLRPRAEQHRQGQRGPGRRLPGPVQAAAAGRLVLGHHHQALAGRSAAGALGDEGVGRRGRLDHLHGPVDRG